MIKKIILGIILVAVLAVSAAASWFFLADSQLKADYHFERAYAMDKQAPKGNRDAFIHYKKAIKTYQAIGDKMGLMKTYIQLGILHWKFGNVLQVERMVLKALDIGEEQLPPAHKVKLYLLIAGTSEPQKAKQYIRTSLQLAEAFELYPEMYNAYYLLGRTYEYKAKFEEAEESYLRAAEIVRKHPTTRYFVDLAKLYESLGELYYGDGRFDLAIEYYDKALVQSFNGDRGVISGYYMKVIGDLYREKNMDQKACEFWKKSIDEYALASQGKTIEERYMDIPEFCMTKKITSDL